MQITLWEIAKSGRVGVCNAIESAKKPFSRRALIQVICIDLLIGWEEGHVYWHRTETNVSGPQDKNQNNRSRVYHSTSISMVH